MKKLFSVVCLCALVSFALLIVVQTGCKPAKSDEMPITTASKEARKLYIEGRELAEYYHINKANDLFKRAVEIDPEFALAYLYKGGTSSETKDFQEGLAKAVSLAPKVSEGEQKLIAGQQAAVGENNAAKANQIYQELAGLFPKDKRIHWYLAGTYGGLQEFDKEIAALEKAIALDKNFAPVYETLGYVYRWRNQFDKAEEAFKEYERLSPQEANSHDILGDLYMKMGKFEDTIQHYGEAVRMDPTFVFSQSKIGSTLALMGKFEEGRQAFLKAMDMQVKPASKVYDQEGIMRTYVYEGDYAKALEAADKAIQMAKELGLPEEASFNPLVKSAIYCELGDFEKADACIADCLNFLESTDLVALIKENQKAEAAFWQAMVAAGRQDFSTALARAETYKQQIAAIKNPAMQKYPGWLFGYVALAQGDARKAIEYFSQGEMDDPWFMYYFAVAKEKAGDAAGAAELYKKVANWNMDSVFYAFVRQKAAAKI
jgi:tetratricopeptide (TPR) repeat protein